MAKKWKESLYPEERLLARTANGKRVPFPIKDADVTAHHNRLQELFAKKFHIPLVKEHQSKAVPMTLEQWEAFKAKNQELIWGEVENSRVTAANKLELLCDIPNEKDMERINAIKYVSPGFRPDIEDGTGNKFPGLSIAHLAVTPTPVQQMQSPEWKNLSAAEPADEIWLDMEEAPGDTGGPPPADDAKKTPPTPTMDAGNMDVAEGLARACKLLAQEPFGIHVSPCADMKSFLAHLETGLETARHHMGKGKQNPGEGDGEGDDDMSATASNRDDQPKVAPGNPQILMSLEQEKTARTAAEDRLKKRDAKLLTTHKTKLTDRIKRDFAHSPHQEAVWLSRLEETQLALDDAGELVPNNLTYFLDNIEEMELLPPDLTEPVELSLERSDIDPTRTNKPTDEKTSDAIANDMTGGKYGRQQAARLKKQGA